jgi:diguanylate cyclase (GGDEF)-like protein/PAS domain S-box-containing protein
MLINILKLKKAIITGIVLILLELALINNIYAEDNKEQKNVLIINSYNQGFAWSKDITDGVIDTMNKSGVNPDTFVEYMDWKSYPTDENLQYLTDYFKYKYQNKSIDMLITSDDAALEFALKNRESLFSNAPVVFCGVNQKGVIKITDGYKNFTGILEEIDPTDTVKMALSINPSLKNVYVLFDNSESGASTGEIVIDKIKKAKMNLNTIPLNNLSYEELIKNVRSYDMDSIILFTTYYSDVNGKIVELEKVAREISRNSSVPVYHLYDIGLNNGAFGGVMTGGRIHGESAAKVALRILGGENPNDIPIISPKAVRKVFDFQQLKRFNVSLNKIPKDSEVINKQFSFFESYRTLVISVLAAFIILVFFVCSLLFYIGRIKNIKKNLSESHEELTQVYEELAASDEELKQQFDEISYVQERLTKSEERFRLAADGSNAIIWDVDMLNMQYQFSDMWYVLLGYEKNEIDEANGGWRTIIHPDDCAYADKSRNMHLDGKTPFYNCEYRMRMKNGEYKWFNVRGKVLQDSNGNNVRFAGSMIDISERKEYETKLQDSYHELEATYEELTAVQEELRQQYDEILVNHERIKITEERLTHLAYHDTLTGLLNKTSLYENSHKSVFFYHNVKAALLFIDMDHFKYINDTMGHAFGDQLIIKISERLTTLLNENCSIYRLSGDEFIIILQNIRSKKDAEVFASHLLTGFKKEFNILNSVLYISLSIGISMYPEHGTDIDELLKYADIAMYRAKETGRNNYVVHNQLMNEVFIDRVNIERNLHAALEKKEFEIHYQPQLDLKSNKITGFEALLRWKSPELGYVSPLKFIKVAEDTHLIIPLGTWVLKNACAFLQKLHKKGYMDLSVSVNISMLQLLQTDFNDLVINALEYFALKPDDLELEITESILMESFETIGSKLQKLSEQGVRIALDDFGKGYSSLTYLKQLPISTLKVDKSFIDNISDENDKKSLTGHIVTIGKSMGMCVIAEGVESEEQLKYLVKHDCDKIQGFLFSKPLTENELIKLIDMKQV